MSTIATGDSTGQNEVTILARLFDGESGQMPADVARHILTLGFSEADKARMHDLTVRNQEGSLTPAETEELFGYAKSGTLLSILKSKARRVLRVKPKKRTPA